jgi:hypothetical protein
MRKLLTFSLLIMAISIYSIRVMGQTMPSLKDLSSSDYSFTSWASTAPAGTYPENMYFHRTSTQDPGLSIEMTSNYTSAYNSTSGTRINGMDDDGITFVNTSTNGNLGAAVLGLNTSGRTNIQVSWLGGTHTQTDGTRVYAIRLQYRIGSGSWTDVPGPVEYSSSGQSAGHSQNFGPTTLPSSCDNQPAVYLRWKYYSVSGSGNRPELRLDDISVTSSPSSSNSITTGSVSTPPFCINSTTSASGTVAYTATGTYTSSTFTAYLSDASGSFASPTAIGNATVTGTNPSGSINITIPAGTASGTGYKIRINSDSPAVTGTESTNFEIVNGANNVSSTTANPNDQQVALSWVNPSACYDEIMIVAKQGSAVSGTPSGDGSLYSANLSFGSGTPFDGGYVVYKGTTSPQTVTNLTNGQEYFFTFFTRKGTDWSSGVTVSSTPNGQPTITEVILPQYIQGINGTNNNRMPFAFRATLQNLTPNATYRYFNQVVLSSDGATQNGAGNCIFAYPAGFVRSTGPSLSSTGNYGEFTTDATGSYTGWFITEPTGNARFTPGNQVYMRIMLNDGAGGTSVSTRLTTTNYATVINFVTNNSSTEGSGFYSSSFSASKNFVFLYDNTSGSGRPLAGTFVENDGTTGGTAYPSFYQNNVDGQNGKWGVIIPNTAANGVRRIAYYDINTGNLLYVQKDADGTWGTTNTANPTNGSTGAEIPHNQADEMEIFSGFNIDLQNGQTLTVGALTTNNLLTLEDGASLIGGSTNGAVTLKRNIAGTNQFHLISSPVSGAVVGNVFPASQYNTLWLREYDEPTGSWVNKTIADNFATGKGYSLVTTDAGTTATFAGNLVNTDQNLTLSYQGTSGNSSYDGWNLLGNPFSSALDRDLGSWNPTNVEPAVYVFDNGNYLSWNGTGTLTDGIIPLGQGFFMKAQANNGTVTLPAAARVHSNQAFYKSSPVNTLRVDVSSGANAYTDALVIRYAEGASAEYDAAYDARKLSGLADAPEIWCPGEVSTSLNTLPSIEENPEVSIAFKPAAEALHTLSFSGLESFEYSGPILLTDLLTGSHIDLRHQTKYEFMASSSQPENRFKLTFASVGIDEPQALNGVNAWYQDGAIRLAQLPATPCQAELYSTDGKLLLSARVMPTQNHIPVSLKSAVYILRLLDGNQVRNIKFIVK